MGAFYWCIIYICNEPLVHEGCICVYKMTTIEGNGGSLSSTRIADLCVSFLIGDISLVGVVRSGEFSKEICITLSRNTYVLVAKPIHSQFLQK